MGMRRGMKEGGCSLRFSFFFSFFPFLSHFLTRSWTEHPLASSISAFSVSHLVPCLPPPSLSPPLPPFLLSFSCRSPQRAP